MINRISENFISIYGKILSCILLFLFSVFPFNNAKATHAAGADLQYTWISGKTYQVTVSFYRDCAGVAAPASITLNAKSTSCSENRDYTLNLVSGTGQEITFPCYSVQTKCSSSSSSFTGYQKYTYSNNVTLPQFCSDWIFNFYICCRNCAITTLNNPCSDMMYIEATLNNLVAPSNSSPRFTNVPVAFLCTNQSSVYNHGVIDPNGDSLVYSFVAPKTYNTGNNTVGNVTYNSGYSASQPLTSSPAVTMNSSNGDIKVNPTVNGEVGVAAILVKEYRNGILIGSVIRDMQFLTKVCNPNLLPSSSGINGSAIFDTTVCVGTSISFTINSSDPNAADTVNMSWNNGITGATFSTSVSTRPVGTFSWTPGLSDARSQPYLFTVTVRDNACPTNGSQTFGFVIRVPLITASASSPSFNGYNLACNGVNSGSAIATASGGNLPYAYNWNPSAQSTQTAVNLSTGTYTVTITDSKGCTKTASTILTQPPTAVSSSVTSVTDPNCSGGSNGTSTISGAGGIGPYTYLWTPTGQTTATAVGLAANIYTARVTDQNGCSSQQAVAINNPPVLNPSIFLFQDVTCQGNANGSINISVSGGTPPYTHSWSNGKTTSNITGLGPGNYSDTVRDAKGCVQVISQAIIEPGSAVGIPSSSVSTTNVSCFGGNNGTANVNPSGGTIPYTITWSNGDVGNTADTLVVGSYNVHIVDGNGCTFDSILPITQPSILSSTFTNVSSSPSGLNIACKGDTSGRAKVSPTGGTAPFSYSWSNGSIVDSIKNVGAGTFTVQITDFKGCIYNDTIILTQPSVKLNDSLRHKDVGCKGESSGGIRALSFGGASPYTYLWNNGKITDSIGDLTAGFYQVTITDTNGCQKVDTITIQEPSILVPLLLPSSYIGAINVSCNGDTSGSATINVFGGTPPFTYLWSQGGTTSSVTGLNAGDVAVHVVDANGCSITRDTSLNEPPPFAYAQVMRNPLCYGDSSGYIKLNVSGSIGPYTYSWSNSDVTDSTGNLKSGTFSVIVRDVNNCPDSTGYTLLDPDSINANPSLSNYQGFNIGCNNDSSGYIVLHATGGDGNFTYTWSNSFTGDSIYNLSAGSYGVTILDGNGCRKDTSVLLNQAPPMTPGFVLSVYNGGSNVSCNNFIDGYAYSSVSGGVPPYVYLWSNGDVADSALGLGPGNHSLTVTDSNGCAVSFPFALTQPSPLVTNPSLSNFNGFNVTCFGDTNGCVTISASGGNGPYSYVWDFQDTITATTLCNLPADTFSVRILDANGCHIDTSFILTSPQQISDNTTLSNFGGYQIQCSGMSNGNIDVNVTGGVAPFSYIWSTTDTTEDLSNLITGAYQVIITDANSCKDTVNYNLIEPSIITDNIVTVASTCFLPNGSAQVNVSGGVSPYSYLWSNSDLTNIADSLFAGSITVQITDSNGCVKNDSTTISGSQPFSANYTVTNAYCAGIDNGSVQIILNGGNPPYQFSWSNGDIGDLADSLGGGYAVVNYTDQIGCMGADSVNIIQLTTLASSIIASSNVSCNGMNDGFVTVSPVSGGAPPYLYSWSNGDAGITADSLSGGNVTLTISDANNCNITFSATIIDPLPLTLSVTAQSLTCDGSRDGVILATVGGGTLPYTYSWTPSVSTDSIAANLNDGYYQLTLTDFRNCIQMASVNVGIGDCDLSLPSGFSPNGDGRNDIYEIHGLSKFPKNTFQVFNRWGNEVFSVVNYSNTEWHGQNSHGENLPEGTYYVMFKVKDSDVSKYTFVDLRR